jgi:hypothetical protein
VIHHDKQRRRAALEGNGDIGQPGPSALSSCYGEAVDGAGFHPLQGEPSWPRAADLRSGHELEVDAVVGEEPQMPVARVLQRDRSSWLPDGAKRNCAITGPCFI